MASLGASSAALPSVVYASATHNAPTLRLPPTETATAKPEVKPTGVPKPIQNSQLQLGEGDKEQQQVLPGLAEEDKVTPELSLLDEERLREEEERDSDLLIGPDQLGETEKYDPRDAFEQQAQRISDLVDRFEDFLRKLNEVVTKVTGENETQQSLADKFTLPDEAEEIFAAIEATAAALLKEANQPEFSPANGGDRKETFDFENLSRRERRSLNVVY